MPAAGVTATPAKLIAKTVDRYKKGERIAALALGARSLRSRRVYLDQGGQGRRARTGQS
jgi:hypothetical protein